MTKNENLKMEPGMSRKQCFFCSCQHLFHLSGIFITRRAWESGLDSRQIKRGTFLLWEVTRIQLMTICLQILSIKPNWQNIGPSNFLCLWITSKNCGLILYCSTILLYASHKYKSLQNQCSVEWRVLNKSYDYTCSTMHVVIQIWCKNQIN